MEAACQEPVHRSGVRSAFVLFVLELVQLAQDVDRDPNMIIRESVNGMGIVEQNIRIKNVVLDRCPVPVERLGSP